MTEPRGHGEPPRPARYWWRFLLATVLIVATSASATTAFALGLLTPPPDLPNIPDLPERSSGEPQNFLILGVDRRVGEEFEEEPGRSDTAILLRLDPKRDSISVISIPRDLEVEIPGIGTGKFNEAYAYGGPKLTLRTVRSLTKLPINHIVVVDFLGFVRAVTDAGCVHVDVDRRYFHSNEGLPAEEQYAEIDVQPGYQLMCGRPALDYVRYRHTDTDIVRSARQQDFLGAARGLVGAADVLDEDGALSTLTEYTRSDIDDRSTLIEVLRLLLDVRDAGLRQVEFPAELGPSYVTTTPKRMKRAIAEFRGAGGSKVSGRGSGEDPGGRKEKEKEPRRETAGDRAEPGGDGLVPAREAGEEEARIAAEALPEPFPVFYPTRLPAGTHFAVSDPVEGLVDPYVYRVKEGLEPDSPRHQAYRMVLVAEGSDGPRYFGLQGIRGWADPPILADPSLTRTIGGRDFDVYLDGDRVKLVAWHLGENSYWIANDLGRSLGNEQMLGIARSVAVSGSKSKPGA